MRHMGQKRESVRLLEIRTQAVHLELTEAISDKMKKTGMDYIDAFGAVCKEQPDLWREHERLSGFVR